MAGAHKTGIRKGALPSPENAKERICLKCQKLFNSIGAGNRICPNCTRLNAASIRSSSRLETVGLQKHRSRLRSGVKPSD